MSIERHPHPSRDRRQRPQISASIRPYGTSGYNGRMLAEAMRTMKGSAILTINDHPVMRDVFKDFTMDYVKIDYTIGGGSRGKGRQELIFQNW